MNLSFHIHKGLSKIAVGAFTKIMHYEHEQKNGKNIPLPIIFSFSMTSNRQRRPHLICRGKNAIHKRFYGSDLVPITRTKIYDFKFKTFIQQVRVEKKKTKIAVISTLV